jgi:predicted MFS family arabinose efflux permease
VLDLTGAPFDAGLVRFMATLPLLVLYLPAGAVVDRYDRRRVMLFTEAGRLVALGSLALAIALGVPTLAHVLIVAAIAGSCGTFFQVAELSAVPRLVARAQLPAALAQNAARAYVGIIVGQTAGGLLYAIGRAVPFVVDSVTYLISLMSIALIRTPMQERAGTTARGGSIREGLAWLWRDPFLRTTMLLFAGNNIVVNSLYLALIVIARGHGASSQEIGVMLGCIGVGGLAGSAAAPRLARRLSLRAVVLLMLGLKAVLTPLLIFMPNALTLGIAFGAMFFVDATGGAAVGARQLAAIPDHLQGRVNGALHQVTLGSVPLASLVVGALLQSAGPTATILALAVVMIATTGAAVTSRAIRAASATGA